jgi:hypothetical protein
MKPRVSERRRKERGFMEEAYGDIPVCDFCRERAMVVVRFNALRETELDFSGSESQLLQEN